MKANPLTTVSQWVAAGGIATGLAHILIPVTKESPKAVGFAGKKWNGSATKSYPCVIWLPKSKLALVIDDYYTQKLEGQNYLVPCWLKQLKEVEGFIFE